MRTTPANINNPYASAFIDNLSNKRYETKTANLSDKMTENIFNSSPVLSDEVSFNKNYAEFNYLKAADKSLEFSSGKEVDYLLSEIETKLESNKSSLETKANSKKSLGKVWDSIKGAVGFGTRGELNDIEKLKTKLDEIKTNPTPESVQELYTEVFGENADINSINEAAAVSESLNDGTFTLSDGKQISKQDIINQLSMQAIGLKENFDDKLNSQGIISKGLNFLNNNVMGLGTTERMTNAQIDEYNSLIQKLNDASSPEEFASIYKAATGDNLTQESIQELFNGSSKIDNSPAAESVMDYEQTQKTALTTFSGIATGIATAAAPFTGGASLVAGAGIGAAVNVGVKGLDSATRNNDKGFFTNLSEYTEKDLIKDVAVGAVNGLSNTVGNKIGSKLTKGFAAKKLGQEAVENMSEKALQKTLSTGTRLMCEFADGAADGTISNSAEYIIDCALGNSKFDIKTLKDRAILGGVMGGVMSAGMKEGTALLYTGGKAAYSSLFDVNKTAADLVSESTENSSKLFNFSETEISAKIEEPELKLATDGALDIEQPAIKTIEQSEIKAVPDDMEIKLSETEVKANAPAAPKAEVSARAQELYSQIEGLKDAKEVFDILGVLSKEGNLKGRLDISRIAADDDIMSAISKKYGSGYADAIKWAADGYDGNKILQVEAEGMLSRQKGRAASSVESIKRLYDFSNLANTKVNVNGKTCTISVEDISPNKGADGIFTERISLNAEDGSVSTFTRQLDSEGRLLSIKNSAGGEVNYRYDCYEFNADIEDDLPLTMFTSDGGKTYYAITNGKNAKVCLVDNITSDNRVVLDHTIDGASAAGELKIIEGSSTLLNKDMPQELLSSDIKKIDDLLYVINDKTSKLAKDKQHTVLSIVTDNDGNIVSLTRNAGNIQNKGMKDLLRYMYAPDQNIYAFECAEMNSLANMIEKFGVSDFSGYRVYSIHKNGVWKIDPNCSACSQTLKLFGFIDGNGELSANDQLDIVNPTKIINRIKHASGFDKAA